MRSTSTRWIIILSLVILIAGLAIYFLQSYTQHFDTSRYTQIYSSGWYGYTFRYPQEANISDPLNIYGRKVDIFLTTKDSSNPPTCILTTDRYLGQERYSGDSEKTPVGTLTFNNISWSKEKYVDNPGEILYEYKGVVWKTEKNNITYLFESRRKDEKWCESIVSTFELSVHPSKPLAVEAQKTKQAALLYAKEKYPEKIFYAAGFLYANTSIFDSNYNTPPSTPSLENSIRAEVRVGDPMVIRNPIIYKPGWSKSIFVNKNNGVWVVDESDQ